MQADSGVNRLMAFLRPDRRRRIDALIDYFGGAPDARTGRLRRGRSGRAARAHRELPATVARRAGAKGIEGRYPAWT